MRWRGQRESDNVEDRRGEGGGFGFPFPRGGMRFPGSGSRGGGGGIGILGLLIILGLMFFFGVDPRVIMQGGGPGGQPTTFPDINLPQSRPDATNFPVPGQRQSAPVQRPQSSSEDDLKRFVSVVLADTEDVWRSLLARYDLRYRDPKLVLFSARPVPAVSQSLSVTEKLLNVLGRSAKLSFEHPISVGDEVG